MRLDLILRDYVRPLGFKSRPASDYNIEYPWMRERDRLELLRARHDLLHAHADLRDIRERDGRLGPVYEHMIADEDAQIARIDALLGRIRELDERFGADLHDEEREYARGGPRGMSGAGVVKAAREVAGMSAQEFGHLLGYKGTDGTRAKRVYELEQGKRDIPGAMEQLCRVIVDAGYVPGVLLYR
ncbi:hypothetical protein [Salinarimonas rosea]|uniref:hypothetical protein n=1 Tax=Salinarimonas rosea TaxID=552063 RepID=UPI0004239D83|nr:hypothetical protein [Salinarimonas rosea]